MGNATLIAQLKRVNGPIYIGMDTDEAGQAAVPKIAAELMEEGIRPTQIRVVTWPAHDANDWLQAGATAEEALALLRESPTWVEVLIERAALDDGKGFQAGARQELFRVLAELDDFELQRFRDQACRQLKMRRADFNALLRSAKKATGSGSEEPPEFEVIDGNTCQHATDRSGNAVCRVLANFEARINTQIVVDDGSEEERQFVVEGSLADGSPLPEVEVLAKDYPAMAWVLEKWGAWAIIKSGAATKDRLREAIQYLNPRPPTRHVYGHTGWRVIDGEPVYLALDGAVGRKGVEVRLPQDLARYRLPVQPEDSQAALAASLRFLETGDYGVTVPLWAAMYLAPLSSIIQPSFTLWIFGTTGGMKSTIAALALCHYGAFTYGTPPASWTGTASALEKKAFLIKDAPLWIDDYTAQNTLSGANELKSKTDQLLRDWGNRAGKSRMRSDLSLRQTYIPRGLIICTGEQLPPGQSIQARLFQVELDPTIIRRGEGSPLSEAQAKDAPLYPHAMGGYLLWLAGQLKELESRLPAQLLQYAEAAREEGAHLRIPMNVATLFVGWEMGLQYARQMGVIDAQEYEGRRAMGWHMLVRLGEEQRAVGEDEKPVELYMNAITEMLAQGSAYLRHREQHDGGDRDYPAASNRAPYAQMLGYYGKNGAELCSYEDSPFWFLLPEVAYRAVSTFYSPGRGGFPDSERGIKVRLREQGLLIPGKGRPFDVKISAQLPWVLRIRRPRPDKDDISED